MKQFDLSLWLENKSRKVVTRSGHNVRILCTDSRGNMPIVALVEFETLDGVQIFYSDGRNESHREYDLFFADDEEELPEFEKALLAAFNCVAGKVVTTIGTASFQEDVDEWSKPLLDLARKELQPEFDKELDEAYKTRDEVVYLEGYDKGHEDALKDLPKWKRNKPNEKYIHNKGYYLTWNELEKLPKEE